MTETTPGVDNLPPRGANGRWRKGVDSLERDAEACRLYVAGKTYLEIAEELGYGNKSNAHRAVQKTLAETVQAPADEVRMLLKARNEEIYVLARDIALKSHLAHSQGRVVTHRGEPLVDDGPKLAAMDRMIKALEQIGKLVGAFAPQKFENLTLEAIQAEIAKLEAEARAAGEEIP